MALVLVVSGVAPLHLHAACRSLRFVLALASHDLHTFSFDSVRVIQFELNILDDEGPDFVAEPVGV